MTTYPKSFYVTGTFHGSIVCCSCEGEARRLFHAYYNGESIISISIDLIKKGKMITKSLQGVKNLDSFPFEV